MSRPWEVSVDKVWSGWEGSQTVAGSDGTLSQRRTHQPPTAVLLESVNHRDVGGGLEVLCFAALASHGAVLGFFLYFFHETQKIARHF